MLLDIFHTVVYWAAVVFAAFALVHAIRQRSDAYTATGKFTKPVWIGIIAVALVVLLLMGPISIFGIIAVVAVGIYMADVRPKVNEIQGR